MTISFAEDLARHILSHRLRGVPELVEAWENVRAGAATYSGNQVSALKAFLPEVRPAAPPEHVQSFVAEHLWHWTMLNDPAEPTLRRVFGPKFRVTAPGGDGLTVREGDTLTFTIWEIKKHTGIHLSSVVNEAYRQLNDHAAEYLAEYSAVEQVAEPDIAALVGKLVPSWITGDIAARAGVTLATGTSPQRSYTTMGKHFLHLRGADARHGTTMVVPDFGDFAQRVQRLLWIGL